MMYRKHKTILKIIFSIIKLKPKNMTQAQKEAVLNSCNELEKIDSIEIAHEKKITTYGNFSVEDFNSKLKM